MAFFRSLGGAFGVAMSGTILAGTLRAWLPRGTSPNLGLSELRALPPALRIEVTGAYGHALALMFGMAALIMAAGFVVVVFLPELPLRGPK